MTEVTDAEGKPGPFNSSTAKAAPRPGGIHRDGFHHSDLSAAFMIHVSHC